MAKKGFTNLIDTVSEVAKRDKWVRTYNKKLDYLYWANPSISKDVRLIKASKEVFLYLSPKGLVEGIGVEYLKSNFIQHHPDYKDLPKLFTEKIDETTFVISKENKKSAVNEFERFTKDLTSDIYKENLENKQTMDDLDKLIDMAIAN